ncbi:MAG: protein kinase family protein, partial [Oligoflexia bacterium]|nr:protein kinase family protein [Oligoflexia bacterium]
PSGIQLTYAWHFDSAKLQIVCTKPEGQGGDCPSLNDDGVRNRLLAEWLPFMQQLIGVASSQTGSEDDGQCILAGKSTMQIEYFLRLNEEVLASHFSRELTQYFNSYQRNIQRVNVELQHSNLTPGILLDKIKTVISSIDRPLNDMPSDPRKITTISYLARLNKSAADGTDVVDITDEAIDAMLTPCDIIIPLWKIEPLNESKSKKLIYAISLRRPVMQVLMIPKEGERAVVTFNNMRNELYIQQKMLQRSISKVAIANYYYIDENKRKIYVIRDYYPETLLDFMNRDLDFAVHDPIKTVDLALGAAITLQKLHQNNFRHKDIKTDNFFLDGNGEIIFNDFEFAYIGGDPNTVRQMLSTALSPQYVSPFYLEKFDLLTGEEVQSPLELCSRIDAANDVWGLGIIFFEMLFGKRPGFVSSDLELTEEQYDGIYRNLMGLVQNDDQDDVESEMALAALERCNRLGNAYFKSRPMARTLQSATGLGSIILRMLRIDYTKGISIDAVVAELRDLKIKIIELQGI